jgi:hypothetical protein
MKILSAILYFLGQHPFWSMPLLFLAFGAIGVAMAQWRGNRGWYGLALVGYLGSQANVFAGHFLNAMFLNAYGTLGTAVITHSEKTDSMLNNQYIRAYDAVLKTADGRDVVTAFDTMSASIYPIRNAILIPPLGETFVVKYIPGFERNIVIMSDLSDYGKRRLIREDRGPVDKAKAQLAASPTNETFIAEYRNALREFLDKHGRDGDPDLIQSYQRALKSLDAD